MLFFDHRPIAAFVAIINQRDGRALTVRRGEYTGFPGGLVPDNTTIDQFARSVIWPVALCKGRLDVRHVLVSRFDGEWDGKPVSAQVIGCPSLVLEPLQNAGAAWTDLGDQTVRFDVFVDEFKRERFKCPLVFPPHVAA